MTERTDESTDLYRDTCLRPVTLYSLVNGLPTDSILKKLLFSPLWVPLLCSTVRRTVSTALFSTRNNDNVGRPLVLTVVVIVTLRPSGTTVMSRRLGGWRPWWIKTGTTILSFLLGIPNLVRVNT